MAAELQHIKSHVLRALHITDLGAQRWASSMKAYLSVWKDTGIAAAAWKLTTPDCIWPFANQNGDGR